MFTKRFRVLAVLVGMGLTLLLAGGVVYASSLSTTQLVGTWVNVNSNTRGIVEIKITDNGNGGITVHAYGACTPTPCDWGTTKGKVFSATFNTTEAIGFTAKYKDDIANDLLTGVVSQTKKGSRLHLNDFEHYVDGSGRQDHVNLDTFKQSQ